MRIISEFHDYYDSVQAQGQDQTVVWVRKTEEHEFAKTRGGMSIHLRENQNTPNAYPFPVFRHGIGYVRDEKIRVSQYIIGFCGKIYPCLKLEVWLSDKDKPAYCYNIDEVDAFVDQHLEDRALQEYHRTKGYGKWYQRKIPGRRSGYLEFFDICRQKQDSFESWFIDNHCPVFLAHIDRYKSEVTFNAPLKELEFYRLFDVYSAFQEIAMYYGGVLGGVREHVPDVDDKTLAEAKGFDKWSFRKPPAES